MKFFCIHPGASTSTADVYSGLTRALQREGHDLVHYRLDQRISDSGAWFHWKWNRLKKQGEIRDKATPADVLLHAHGDLLIRLMMHECEWVLIFSSMYTPLAIVKAMKKAGHKVAVVFTESPYEDDAQLRFVEHVDIAWTNERSSVERLRKGGDHVYYMPQGYDPEIHTIGHVAERAFQAHDVVFVGSGFHERIATLSNVDWTGIDLGLYGTWGHVGSRSVLRRYLRSGEIPNEVTASLYRRARIGLNLYRTSRGFGDRVGKIDKESRTFNRYGAESLNLRAYELAACGCFQVSDYREEVREVFGDLIPTFKNGAELEQIIRDYLEDPNERMRIARLIPEAVRPHTWDVRARQLVSEIQELENVEQQLAIG